MDFAIDDRLEDNSLAFKLGIRAGDILMSVDGNNINSHNDYLRIIYNLEDVTMVEVIRNGELISLERTNND